MKHVAQIEWEIDEPVDLPDEWDVPDDVPDEEVAEFLSDVFGQLVNSYVQE